MKAKMYTDKRGWKFGVRPGIGGTVYRGHFQRADHSGPYNGWHGMRLPWRDTFDEAQFDLDHYAKRHGWQEYTPEWMSDG